MSELVEFSVKNDPFQGEIEHFAESIRNGNRATRYDIEQAIMMQQMLNAIYESARLGREVEIE